MPELSVTAKLGNLIPCSKNNAKKTAEVKFLLPSFCKMPNIWHFEMPVDDAASGAAVPSTREFNSMKYFRIT